MRLVDDVGVFLARKLGLLLVGPLKVVEVLEKQNPRRLLGVVQLRGAAGLFPQNVVDILEGLLEHDRQSSRGIVKSYRKRILLARGSFESSGYVSADKSFRCKHLIFVVSSWSVEVAQAVTHCRISFLLAAIRMACDAVTVVVGCLATCYPFLSLCCALFGFRRSAS